LGGEGLQQIDRLFRELSRRFPTHHKSTDNTFGAELPANLFREIFESRRLTMIAARQWPQDKPLPDPEQFLARNLLDPTLKDMGYVPTNIEAPNAGK